MPWIYAITAAFEDPEVDEVVYCTASQVSKTEGVMLNVLGRNFDEGRRVPALVIMATQDQARTLSKDRLSKLLEQVPTLRELLAADREREGMFEKFFAGARLGIGWAGSASQLSFHSAGLGFLDEYSRMRADVAGEGDPYVLLSARLKNFMFSKLGVGSTPLLWDLDPTWRLLDGGSCEFWCWPCLHCGESFAPELKILRWPERAPLDEILEAARVVCPRCGGEHEDTDQPVLNDGGQFVPHQRIAGTSRDAVLSRYRVNEAPRPNRRRSFWVSGLCSPWQTFGGIAVAYASAVMSKSIETIQARVNVDLGEPFELRGEAPEWEEVRRLVERYARNTVPHGVQRITIGVDVQKDRLVYVVCGWGFELEMWLIDHGEIWGSTEHHGPWITLQRMLNREYPHAEPEHNTEQFRVDRAHIDSGYDPGSYWTVPTDIIHSFCLRTAQRAAPTKGYATLEKPIRAVKQDVRLGGRTVRGGVVRCDLDTDHFKVLVHSRIRLPDEVETGRWHFHADTDEDFCRQLVAEVLVPTRSGKRDWRVKGENHYLDAMVNAASAAYMVDAQRLLPIDGGTTARPEPELAAVSAEDFIDAPADFLSF
mgnify:CR=1 FL=1